jgi:hypothetical protein
MTEMIIVSLLFLVPLFLFMTMIMKYLDMRSATLQASRYAAFERTVYTVTGNQRSATGLAKLTDSQLANGIRQRFFAEEPSSSKLKLKGAIYQGQNSSTTGFTNKPLWSDASGKKLVGVTSVATKDAHGTEPVEFAADTVLYGALGSWNSKVPPPLNSLTGFQLTFNQYYKTSVSVTPARPNGPVFSSLPTLTFHDNDALLADGWSAPNEAYEKDQAKRAVPSGVLSFLDNPAIKAVLTLGVPDLGYLNTAGGGPDFGYVMVNKAGAVPADRLANYTPPPGGGGSNGQDLNSQIKAVKTQFEKMGYSFVGQTTNSDGSVTLTFSKNGSTVTQTVGGTGTGGSNNTQLVQGSVYDVTKQTISSLTGSGYKVTSGPSYTCNGTTCPKDKKGNIQNNLADKATATLAMTVTTNPNANPPTTVTSTIQLTVVNDPNKSGYSDVTEVTSSTQN